MDAIDWPVLGRGILWVLGLAVSLAAVSHVRWAAKRAGVSLRIAFGWNAFLAPFFAGLTLFASGLALGASRRWETIAWAVLALLFAWQAVLALWQARRADRARDAGAREEKGHETNQ